MNEFSRSRLLSNITYLTKEKNIKVGDLEAEAGVSTGYFSRLKQNDNTTLPNIEVIAAVAKKLGVTIDGLVNNQFDSLTASERYLVDFLGKVLSDTESSEVAWERESTRSMVGSGTTEDGELVNPFFRIEDECVGFIDFDTPRHEEVLYFNSSYHDDENVKLTKNEGFHATLNGNEFWLFDITIEETENGSVKELELYLKKGKQVYPVCHTNDHCASINDLLFSLYLAAIASSKKPKVNATVKAVIDLYMKDLPF